MDYLPLFLDLKNKSCLVIGGGPVACRKIELLLRAGAQVTCLSESFCDRLAALPGEEKNLKLDQGSWDEWQDEYARLSILVAATDNEPLNAEIAKLASEKNVLCNVVSDARDSSFIFPAIVDRNPVIAAVSSGGNAPVLTRLLRGRLEAAIPSAFGSLANLATQFRSEVKTRLSNITQRRAFWEKAFSGTIAELVFTGKQKLAEVALEKELTKWESQDASGEVYLVGAGPGDPDLLTFKALRLMQQADVVLYDALVSKEILDLVKRDAELVYVGKRRSNHALPQEDINQLLVTYAQKGKRVLRLKGGDPFIFGRGGEEIDSLMELGIAFQVVPGITAASGCSAYSGIPLTHRDHAQSVRFITGHLKAGAGDLDLPWQEFLHENQTLVFYMGLNGLAIICNNLIKQGRAKETPIALVERGTTVHQKVHTGTLESMPEYVKSREIHAPTLIIIGNVVTLHRKLAWYSVDQFE